MSLAIKALGATFAKYFDVASPLALPSIQAYWRADDIPLGAVASFTDLTGKGRHLPQATGASQPVNTAAQINGRNALVFDGVDDYLDLNPLVIPQPWELWMVYKRIAHVGGDFLLEVRTASLSGYAQDQAATNVRSIMGGTTTFNTTVGAVGSWLVQRWSSVAGAGASSIVLNNNPSLTAPTTGVMQGGVERFILGAKVGGTLTPNIAVAEAFFTAAAMGAPEQGMIYAYLRDRYGSAVTV